MKVFVTEIFENRRVMYSYYDVSSCQYNEKALLIRLCDKTEFVHNLDYCSFTIF